MYRVHTKKYKYMNYDICLVQTRIVFDIQKKQVNFNVKQEYSSSCYEKLSAYLQQIWEDIWQQIKPVSKSNISLGLFDDLLQIHSN